jgi:hypothetical protein
MQLAGLGRVAERDHAEKLMASAIKEFKQRELGMGQSW